MQPPERYGHGLPLSNRSARIRNFGVSDVRVRNSQVNGTAATVYNQCGVDARRSVPPERWHDFQHRYAGARLSYNASHVALNAVCLYGVRRRNRSALASGTQSTAVLARGAGVIVDTLVA